MTSIDRQVISQIFNAGWDACEAFHRNTPIEEVADPSRDARTLCSRSPGGYHQFKATFPGGKCACGETV